MSWADKIKALQSLDSNIPDTRIETVAEVCEAIVIKFLGSEAYSELAGDVRLEYAVCALSISKIVMSSRIVGEGSSVHESSSWGEGEIRPSEVSEMIKLSKHWDAEAQKTLNSLKAEIPAEIGWVDI